MRGSRVFLGSNSSSSRGSSSRRGDDNRSPRSGLRLAPRPRGRLAWGPALALLASNTTTRPLSAASARLCGLIRCNRRLQGEPLGDAIGKRGAL